VHRNFSTDQLILKHLSAQQLAFALVHTHANEMHFNFLTHHENEGKFYNAMFNRLFQTEQLPIAIQYDVPLSNAVHHWP
jgi:hypothetical protein